MELQRTSLDESTYSVVIRTQSNVSETRAADETGQGLTLMLKEEKGREK